MIERLQLLLVEDNPVDRMAFERFVRREALPYDYKLAPSIAEARELLTSGSFDIVLMDYVLGDGTSFDLLDMLGGIPSLIITGTGDERVAVEAMKRGVYDYLVKDVSGNYLATVPVVVEQTLDRWRTQRELARYQAQLEEMVAERTSELLATGEELRAEIRHRRQIETALRESLEESARNRRLLLALGQAAHMVQRARTPGAVFQVIGEQVTELGLDTVVLSLSADRTHLSVAYHTLSSTVLQDVFALIGTDTAEHLARMLPGNPSYRVVVSGDAEYCELSPFLFSSLLPASVHPSAGQLAALLGWQHGIIAPLRGEEDVWGVLIVLGNVLTESDVPAITAFADQTAIAIENARLSRETQQLIFQVRQQAQRLEQILATIPEGVLLLDTDRRILQKNAVAVDMLKILGDDDRDAPISRLGDLSLDDLLSPQVPPVDVHEVTIEQHTFQIVAKPVESGVGLQRWVIVLHDVTQERAIDERLNQQERLAAVGQLAAGIAHDFNNILATIVLYAQMVGESPDLSARNRERISVLSQQAWHASQLIGQILDFSRRTMLDRHPLDLVPLLADQVKLLARTLPETIDIDLGYGDDAYVVDADPTGVQQILTNLAVNARDAMPEGGELHIGLDLVTVDPLQPPPLIGLEAGEWVLLTVSDEGVGIAPHVLPHVFEPFFTTKGPGGGSGLGLAQVHGIVGQHGGQIGVVTEMGCGTTFSIYLPALVADTSSEGVLCSSEQVQGKGEIILVVEDEPALRSAFAAILEQWNYRVLEAENGHSALAQMSIRGDEIALVLSDVTMPGMGGKDLFSALRERGWQTPMILLSGYPLGEDLGSLKARGLSACLAKPPDLDRLAQAVADAVR